MACKMIVPRLPPGRAQWQLDLKNSGLCRIRLNVQIILWQKFMMGKRCKATEADAKNLGEFLK